MFSYLFKHNIHEAKNVIHTMHNYLNLSIMNHISSEKYLNIEIKYILEYLSTQSLVAVVENYCSVSEWLNWHILRMRMDIQYLLLILIVVRFAQQSFIAIHISQCSDGPSFKLWKIKEQWKWSRSLRLVMFWNPLHWFSPNFFKMEFFCSRQQRIKPKSSTLAFLCRKSSY